MRDGRAGLLARVPRNLAAIAVALVFAFPLFVMVLGSLRPAGVPPARSITLPPWPPAWSNYPEVFGFANLGRGLVNSLIVVFMFVPLSVVVASWAGLCIARMRPARRVRWVVISVIALMVPVTFLILGRFFLFRVTGLTGSFAPLVAPALLGGSPLFVLLYIWAFSRIPSTLFDVAEIEGVGPFGMWWRVAMPRVGPITACVAMLAFLASWNDFLAPLLYLSDPKMFTLPLSLRVMSGADPANAPLMLAGAVVAVVPVVLALVYVQHRLLGEHFRPRA